MIQELSLPRKIYAGENVFNTVGKIAQDFGYKNLFIISDKVMESMGYLDTLKKNLDAESITYDIYTDTVPEPTVASIAPARDIMAQKPYDAVIAIGGGSVIDSAKAIAIWAKYGGEMRDYKFPRIVNELGVPLIAIPTTAGTGSEATKVTVITDENTSEKMMCMGLGFLPTVAVVDYTLTLTCPKRLTADSGIDALTHAVEAYVSQKASTFTDTIALKAMASIFPNLRTVYNTPDDTSARENMMFGSMLAGMAFSNASVALVHGMSRPIGAFFHVPHGMSNAMLFPTITKFSMQSAIGKYADCARVCGMTDTHNDQKAAEIFVHELIKLNQDLEVPSLKQFGADETIYFNSIDTMAEQALASGSPNNNPRIPNKQEIIDLYNDIWQH